MSGKTRTAPPTRLQDNLPQGATLAHTREDARALARLIWGRIRAAHDERPATDPAADAPARHA